MEKKIWIVLLLVLGFGLIISNSAFATIVDSGHDFSHSSWNTTGEICVVCHTPHNSTGTIAPLWNHAITAVTNFIPYASSTLNATVGQPSLSSKACLSCHDGTVALDSFGGNTGTTFIPADHLIGTDLSNDHPVSFTYDQSLATTDGGLYDPTVQTVGSLSGKTIDAGLLIDHKMECGSCHDVHRVKGNSPSVDDLLIVNNAQSAFCLTCHKK